MSLPIENKETDIKWEKTKVRGTSFVIDPELKQKGLEFIKDKEGCKLIGVIQLDPKTVRITWLKPDNNWDCGLLK